MNAFKRFENFAEGIQEMCNISNTINNVFLDNFESLPETSEEAASMLLDIVKDNIPSIYDEDFPMSRAISVSALEVSYKCPNQISFGWKVIFDRETGATEYEFRISLNNFNNQFARKSAVMCEAENNGWKLVDSIPRPRKFNNNKRKYNNDIEVSSKEVVDEEVVEDDAE